MVQLVETGIVLMVVTTVLVELVFCYSLNRQIANERGRFASFRRITLSGLLLSGAGLVLPYAIWIGGYTGSGRVDYQVAAMLWQFFENKMGLVEFPGLQILNPTLLNHTVLYGLPPVLWVLMVIRYCTDKTSGPKTVALGILCYLPIVSRDMSVLIWAFNNGFSILSFPLPLLLILGAVMMKVLRPREVTHPWEYLEPSGQLA